MGFDEGSIILNSDNETFYAGQTIFGKLVFEQDKVKTFRGIYVKMKGFCEVHWTKTTTRRHNDRTHTHVENYNSYEEYFSRKVFLVGGESGEYHLQPGKHEFPFECPIPANCPSSFEGDHGHVRYEIKIVVDRAFKLDQEKSKRIRVIAPLDLNTNPYCQEPMQFDIEDTYCCCCMGNGSSETVVKLPVSGYCPGQTIPIEINCSNQGRVEIDQIKLAIRKRITYHAVQSPGTKHHSEVVAEIKKGPIPGGTTRSWMVDMNVPIIDVYNMGSCRYIDIEYDFQVTVCPEGCHNDSEDTRGLIIGTVPLIGQQDNVPIPLQDQMPKQVQPIMNQPMLNPNFYPPQNTPYPVQNTPYPQNPPYPVQYPYPSQNSPYSTPKQPYPNVTPYPVTSSPSPYPANTQSIPYANSNEQNTPNIPLYPIKPSATPGMIPSEPVTQSPGLKTGTFGFLPTGNAAVPSLPPGASVPYPTTPLNNPYATASAPEPSTPDDGKTTTPGGDAKDPLLDPNPGYNPEFVANENKQ
ncbi:arrestin domain-containing protein 17-like [Battus philenor]|uniref:arrestin domain-containing protein 17-like n=1 Tax=Battus philenor TaxID=42288 RepID=UPI0035CF4BA0